MGISRMDTGTRGPRSVVSSRSSFLVLKEIPGGFDIGAKVKKGHPVSEWGLGLSRAIKPDSSGTNLESSRTVGTPLTLTLQKTAHLSQFLNIVNNGATVPEVKLFNLKSHGMDDATGDVVLEFTLTNVRFQRGEINLKRQAGGYTTGNTDIIRSNEPGWASDTDPNTLAQAEDPNNIKNVEDVFIIEMTYDSISGVWTKIDVNGSSKGNISCFWDFTKITTKRP